MAGCFLFEKSDKIQIIYSKIRCFVYISRFGRFDRFFSADTLGRQKSKSPLGYLDLWTGSSGNHFTFFSINFNQHSLYRVRIRRCHEAFQCFRCYYCILCNYYAMLQANTPEKTVSSQNKRRESSKEKISAAAR